MEAVIEAPAAEAEETTAAPEVAEPTEVEQPEGVAEETEQPEPEGDAEPAKAAEPEKDIYSGEDGKKIPPKLAPVFKQHPELRAMFFENRELRALGGLKAVREQAKLLEEAGGPSGLHAVRSELEAWEELDGLFSNADPQLAARLFEADPEAAEKFAPAMIETFAQRAPEAYGHVLGRIMLNTMQGFGVYEALAKLQQLASSNKDVQAAMEPLGAFWNTVFETAQKMPERRVDPERQKLDADRQQFEQEREKLFNHGVMSDARGHMEGEIEAQLGRFFAQAGADIKAIRRDDPDYFGVLVKECDDRMADAITKDQAFQTNKSRFQQARDAEGLKQLYRRKIEKDMPDIAKTVYRLFTRGATVAPAKPKPPAQAATAGRPGTSTIMRGTKPPQQAGLQIDWGRTPPGYSDVAQAVLAGRAYVHGRKEIYAWK